MKMVSFWCRMSSYLHDLLSKASPRPLDFSPEDLAGGLGVLLCFRQSLADPEARSCEPAASADGALVFGSLHLLLALCCAMVYLMSWSVRVSQPVSSACLSVGANRKESRAPHVPSFSHNLLCPPCPGFDPRKQAKELGASLDLFGRVFTAGVLSLSRMIQELASWLLWIMLRYEAASKGLATKSVKPAMEITLKVGGAAISPPS